jgi:hypothetical protein
MLGAAQMPLNSGVRHHMTGPTYTCSTCGKEHQGLPTDWGFKLPDAIFDLSYLEKYRRARTNADLCTLDDSRFFVRGLLSLPFTYQEGSFSWGVWVEVDRTTHDFYLENFDEEFAKGSKAEGHLANTIPGFAELRNEALEIEFQDSSSRPSFSFLSGAVHQLAKDQREGVDFARHHEFLDLCGHFAVSDA